MKEAAGSIDLWQESAGAPGDVSYHTPTTQSNQGNTFIRSVQEEAFRLSSLSFLYRAPPYLVANGND